MNIVDKSVQVVTKTDGAGIIKPLCFFITGDDESGEVINVERLVRRDKEIEADKVLTVREGEI
ncbi:hypothetical protein [Clostridium sp.]|uniref:hypothetical protein n=1 Tax=Clostridium sp. TaxID=1506 RepID=UPI0026097A70|nr:hypothetical protein [Clostridium sp.]